MATSPVMAWLQAGLPLTLLCDLVLPDGPDSRHILLTELSPDRRDEVLLSVPRARLVASSVQPA